MRNYLNFIIPTMKRYVNERLALGRKITAIITKRNVKLSIWSHEMNGDLTGDRSSVDGKSLCTRCGFDCSGSQPDLAANSNVK